MVIRLFVHPNSLLKNKKILLIDVQLLISFRQTIKKHHIDIHTKGNSQYFVIRNVALCQTVFSQLCKNVQCNSISNVCSLQLNSSLI